MDQIRPNGLNAPKWTNLLQTCLKESPPTPYVAIYNIFYVYYLNKLYDSLKKLCD